MPFLSAKLFMNPIKIFKQVLKNFKNKLEKRQKMMDRENKKTQELINIELEYLKIAEKKEEKNATHSSVSVKSITMFWVIALLATFF